MIRKSQPLNLAEVRELLEKTEEKDNQKAKKLLEYLKKFSKTKPEKTKEFIKKLEEAGISKLQQKHIVKIADFMPETAADLRSIFFGDINLDSNETEKILGIVKEVK